MFTVKVISQNGMVNLHSFRGVTFVGVESGEQFWHYADEYGIDRLKLLGGTQSEVDNVLNIFGFIVDRDAGLDGFIPLVVGDKVYVTDMSGKTVLSEETSLILKEDKELVEDSAR